jgi:hypothetical protein
VIEPTHARVIVAGQECWKPTHACKCKGPMKGRNEYKHDDAQHRRITVRSMVTDVHHHQGRRDGARNLVMVVGGVPHHTRHGTHPPQDGTAVTEPFNNVYVTCEAHASRPDPALHGLANYVGCFVKIAFRERVPPYQAEHL